MIYNSLAKPKSTVAVAAGFYCDYRAHNAQEVSVVKYIVVYGQIKAADQKYRQTIFGRDIVEQWSRI